MINNELITLWSLRGWKKTKYQCNYNSEVILAFPTITIKKKYKISCPECTFRFTVLDMGTTSFDRTQINKQAKRK